MVLSKKSQNALAIVLDDLSVRFIINIPDEELNTFERVCFQIELAHWFYEDFSREGVSALPSFTLKEFAKQMFNHCVMLKPHANRIEEIFKNWKDYKVRVPGYGAIILNKRLDKCLLVKGWSASSTWSFPKGKINKAEAEVDCAIREVYEETGFNLENHVHENQYIEQIFKQQFVKLYVIPAIPEDTIFVPQTRKEISRIEWKCIDDIPLSFDSKDITKADVRNYFMVIPFMKKLRTWIRKYKKIKNSSLSDSLEEMSLYIEESEKDKAKQESRLLLLSGNPNDKNSIENNQKDNYVKINPFLNFKFNVEDIMKYLEPS